MGKYRRVTFEDRCQIDACLSAGLSLSEIACKLGFHPSTIGRELRRNVYSGRYQPKHAQAQASSRYRLCRRPYKVTDLLHEKIELKLRSGWSPDYIAGRFGLESVAQISRQGIYNHIRRNRGLEKLLLRHGRRGAGRYRQRKRAKQAFLSIADRPEIVDRRERLGDWERDGMYVADRQQVLVLVERKSRYTLLEAVGRVSAKRMTELTNHALARVPIKTFTLTNDNGTEFNDSPNQGVRVYHCTPYKPQERGTVENTIGRLRRHCTTKTKITELDEVKLRELERSINLTPRKCLGYKTPYEVLFKTSIALAS